jgi:predicted kinase
MKVTILRGIQGSGKSTYAGRILNSEDRVACVSADHYFMHNGEYKFDPAKLPEAHATCLRQFISLCHNEVSRHIIVDNTNATVAEIAPYYAIAQAYGYDVEIITLRGVAPIIAAQRNIHGVSLETVQRTHAKLVSEEYRFCPWWKHTVCTEM